MVVAGQYPTGIDHLDADWHVSGLCWCTQWGCYEWEMSQRIWESLVIFDDTSSKPSGNPSFSGPKYLPWGMDSVISSKGTRKLPFRGGYSSGDTHWWSPWKCLVFIWSLITDHTHILLLLHVDAMCVFVLTHSSNFFPLSAHPYWLPWRQMKFS